MATNVLDNANKTVLQGQTAYDIKTRRELKGVSRMRNRVARDRHRSASNTLSKACHRRRLTSTPPAPLVKRYVLHKLSRSITGFIDSAVHLGIDARAKDRVLYRRTTSCAVLSTDGYARTVPGEYNAAYPYDDNTTGFFYGPNYLVGKDYTKSFSNYTYDGRYNFWYDLS